MTSDLNDDVRSVTRSLREVHRVVAEIQLDYMDPGGGGDQAAFAKWQRLIHDPALAWLRPVSALMADVDQMLHDAEVLDADVAGELRARVQRVLGPTEDPEFQEVRDRIGGLTTGYPEVAMVLGDLRRALGALPGPQED